MVCFFSDSAKAVQPTEKQPSPAATLSTKYREFFLRVAGTDKAVDAYELKNILECAFHKGECCMAYNHILLNCTATISWFVGS